MEQSVKIRRFVAIGLVALTILFLFWPSIINLNGKSDAWENATDRMKLLGRSGFADEFARDYVLYRNNSYHSYTDSEVSESEYRDAVNAGRECYDVFMKDGKLSFLKVCTFTPKMLKYAHIDEAAPIVAGMFLWMMFAMLLLFAIAAILMMLFNKSKAFNVLLVVFSFIYGSIFLFLGLCGPIMTAVDSSVKISPVYPGVAAVLLPLFSLAACIVYRRTRPEPDPAPVVQPVYGQQPQNGWNPQQPYYQQQEGWNPPPQPSVNTWEQPTSQPAMKHLQPDEPPMQEAEGRFWTCSVCGSKCPSSSLFCHNCGTRQP